MGQPAAKQGDRVTAVDTHFGPNNVPISTPFAGVLDGNLSPDVKFGGSPAATVGSSATNTPPHVGVFVHPPSNKGTVLLGSNSVRVNGRFAARNGDVALTCNDPADLPVGKVVASGTVRIG